jgi:ABC-type transport system involved in multi-copper enzyme maturation permease subunit
VIEMIRRFVRQKFGSAGLVVALIVLGLVQLLPLAAQGTAAGFSMASWGIFVLAAGSVSRDISSGALQMILSRPIRRTQYLFGRYFGILLSYALFLVATSLLAFLLFHLVVLRTARAGGAADFSTAGLAVAAGEAFLTGAFQAAILLLFSTFLPGIADLLGLLLLYLVLNLPQFSQSAFIRNAGERARENMLPSVEWERVFRGGDVPAAATGRWLFALTVYLVLAAIVFSRRELPYGQD